MSSRVHSGAACGNMPLPPFSLLGAMDASQWPHRGLCSRASSAPIPSFLGNWRACLPSAYRMFHIQPVRPFARSPPPPILPGCLTWRRNHPELLQQAQGIKVGPVFHHLAFVESGDVDPCHCRVFPSGWNAHELCPNKMKGSNSCHGASERLGGIGALVHRCSHLITSTFPFLLSLLAISSAFFIGCMTATLHLMSSCRRPMREGEYPRSGRRGSRLPPVCLKR